MLMFNVLLINAAMMSSCYFHSKAQSMERALELAILASPPTPTTDAIHDWMAI